MRIGLDFDNTLIRYDEVFRQLALDRGWISRSSPVSKAAVKSHLLKKDGNDFRWQALQAEAYGRKILAAKPFPGSRDFIRKALQAGHQLYIVSHKTESSNINASLRLRERAILWLKKNDIPVKAIFASSREEKVRLIKSLNLDLFVDDLPEVLEHPLFPSETQRVHFAPNGERDARAPAVRVASWKEAASQVDIMALIGPRAFSAIRETFGCEPVSARPAAIGGNNRLIRIKLKNGREVLLKRYLKDPQDSRDRALAEFIALTLMWDNGIRCVPRPYCLDPEHGFAVMSWVPGKPLKGRPGASSQVLEATRFLLKLNRLHKKTLNLKLPEGADSRRCLRDYESVIEKRLSRIQAGLKARPHEEASRLVQSRILPLKARVLERFHSRTAEQGFSLDKKLEFSQRTLSPSDFGFHNAVLGKGGRIFWLDFEYFGQDDSAKLIADFLHHVAQKLTAMEKKLFVETFSRGLSDREEFLSRLNLVTDPIALEWILIVLNVFSPEGLARRRYSDPDGDLHGLLQRRLVLAQNLATRLEACLQRI